MQKSVFEFQTIKKDSKRELLVDDVRGIYIPQHFAKVWGECFQGITSDILEDLNQGPHEGATYWESWDYVLKNAYLIDHLNRTWTLEHDECLFMVRNND